MITIKQGQRFFTETETAELTGMCVAHLQSLAKEKHIGTVCSALVAGQRAESRLFTKNDLAILNVLRPAEH